MEDPSPFWYRVRTFKVPVDVAHNLRSHESSHRVQRGDGTENEASFGNLRLRTYCQQVSVRMIFRKHNGPDVG